MRRGDPELDAFLTEEVPAAGEALFRTLVEQLPSVVYVDTNEPRPNSLYVSPQVEPMFGRSAAALMADPDLWTETIHPEDRPRVDREWEHAYRCQEPFTSDYRVVRPDGSVAWVHDTSVLVRDDDGRPRYRQGLMYDITDAKAAEDALRRSEALHRALVENIPAVVYVVAPDDDRKTLYVSPQVEVALGYSRQEWLDQPDIWMELLHPDDREPTLAAHDLANETGRPWSREYRLIAADGRAVWFRDVAMLVRDEAGRARYWQGVQLDITELKEKEEELRAARDELELRVLERTSELEEANEMMSLEIAERKRAEAELRRAEEQYRLLAERGPAVTYVWRVNQPLDEVVYVSPQIQHMLGYTPEEWGREELWMSRLHPDDRDRVLAATERSIATGEPFSMEYRYLARDGHVVWVWDEATLLQRDREGRPLRFHGIMLDITTRKEAEAKASRSERRLRALAEHIPAVIYAKDLHPEAGWIEEPYVSPQLEGMLGYTPEEWLATPGLWFERLHPDDRERARAVVDGLERSDTSWSIEYRMIAKDGRTVWIHDQGLLLDRDENGRPRMVQGVMVDVSGRKRVEQELREAERSYRTLIEQIPAITYIELPSVAPEERLDLVYVSPQCEPILGYRPDELLSDPGHLRRMLHPEDRDAVMERNRRCEETGEPFDVEYRVLAKDGRVVWLHSRAELIRDDAGNPLFWHGVAMDVTDRREAEEHLRDLQRRLERIAAEPEPGVEMALEPDVVAAPEGSPPG
ncbi:MAG: PAS domain-containing protein [Candidatus Velamenicoccus archaeovorus]